MRARVLELQVLRPRALRPRALELRVLRLRALKLPMLLGQRLGALASATRRLVARLLVARLLAIGVPLQHPARSAAAREPWAAPVRSGQVPLVARAPPVALKVHFVQARVLVLAWQVFAQNALGWLVARRDLPRAPLRSRSTPDTTHCKPTSAASAAA
jgi:hypothetical protein